MHFIRREAFRIAPGPGLSEGETLPDISQEVVDYAAVVLWDKSFLDWWEDRRSLTTLKGHRGWVDGGFDCGPAS